MDADLEPVPFYLFLHTAAYLYLSLVTLWKR
jgi:hypothetical protein